MNTLAFLILLSGFIIYNDSRLGRYLLLFLCFFMTSAIIALRIFLSLLALSRFSHFSKACGPPYRYPIAQIRQVTFFFFLFFFLISFFFCFLFFFLPYLSCTQYTQAPWRWFSKPYFLIICLRNFSCPFLIPKRSVLTKTIFL